MSLIEADHRITRMSNRDARRARAQSRNVQRAAANAIAAVKTLDPAEVKRAEIRIARQAKANAERRRAVRLILADPIPDETVEALLFRAKGQRAAAAALDGKAKIKGRAGMGPRSARKRFLDEARRLDLQAEEAWQDQLARHWSEAAANEALAQDEIRIKVAKAENPKSAPAPEIARTVSEVSDWARDKETGAVILDQNGMPTLQTERSTPLRRSRQGLTWLRHKERISAEQYRIGNEAAAVWEAAAAAIEPGRAEIGSIRSPQGKSAVGPADWRLDALRRLKEMEVSILSFVQGSDGEAMVRTCRRICHEGCTVAYLAGDDRYEAVRIEEGLKLGLALIRYWLYASGNETGLTNGAET